VGLGLAAGVGLGQPLAPGQTVLVLLKSDARYSSPVEPEAMFTHQQFKDARVEIFLRVGSSPWTRFGEADVERRIGAKTSWRRRIRRRRLHRPRRHCPRFPAGPAVRRPLDPTHIPPGPWHASRSPRQRVRFEST
jgi:hypothetical protein